MHLQDKLTIDTTRRTRDGYLTISARVAKAGNVQVYGGSEVGRPELSAVRVYRPKDEVFAADTMNSFAHRPVTLGHPAGAVNAATWKAVAKGWTDGEVSREVVGENEFVRVSMLLADAEAISAVESGTRELSMGYDCSLIWESGVTPSGEAYDAIQRGIRSNHVAIVSAARGGPELRLGDSANNGSDRLTADEVERQRYQAAYDHMCDGMSKAWQGTRPVNDNHQAITPQHTKDGRHISALTDAERAYHEMMSRDSDGWKGGA